MDCAVADTARVLEAISTCQSTLTTKIEEIKVDISLIRQDITKLKDLVKETETRISQTEDIIHPRQNSHEDIQHQIQQLAQKHDDLENRARRSNLRFIGLPEGLDPATFPGKASNFNVWQGGLLNHICGGTPPSRARTPPS